MNITDTAVELRPLEHAVLRGVAAMSPVTIQDVGEWAAGWLGLSVRVVEYEDVRNAVFMLDALGWVRPVDEPNACNALVWAITDVGRMVVR